MNTSSFHVNNKNILLTFYKYFITATITTFTRNTWKEFKRFQKSLQMRPVMGQKQLLPALKVNALSYKFGCLIIFVCIVTAVISSHKNHPTEAFDLEVTSWGEFHRLTRCSVMLCCLLFALDLLPSQLMKKKKKISTSSTGHLIKFSWCLM